LKISDKLTESERTRMKYLLKSVLNVDIQKIVDKTIRDMEYQTLYF
jgi:hypothetical protein